MEIKIKIDEEKINRGFVDLQKASSIAIRNTLNIIAALSRKNAIALIKQKFILRNTYTERNIKFQKTESENIALMESRIGAEERADYLALQEEGGKRRSKSGSNIAIPQDESRGGSRRRLVSKQFYLKKIQSKIVRGKFKKNISSRKSQNVARAFVADREKKFLKYSLNIFMIMSFNKQKQRIRFKMKHLYNLSQRYTNIKPTKWLEPAIQQPVNDAQKIYNSQMNKLLKQKEIL